MPKYDVFLIRVWGVHPLLIACLKLSFFSFKLLISKLAKWPPLQHPTLTPTLITPETIQICLAVFFYQLFFIFFSEILAMTQRAHIQKLNINILDYLTQVRVFHNISIYAMLLGILKTLYLIFDSSKGIPMPCCWEY